MPFSFLAWFALAQAAAFASGTEDTQSLVQLQLLSQSAPVQQEDKRALKEKVVSSWAGVRRNLTFIHIPRSGGTAVEDVRLRAKDAPVPMWGVQDVLNQHGLAQINGSTAIKGHGTPKCFLQHHPPNLNAKAFADSDTFCVVRDPVSRMISQFGFLVQMFSNRHNCTAASLNNYFNRSLLDASANPYTNDCHLMPQSAYVFGWNSSASPPQLVNTGVRFCKNVLRFEHIEDDFNNLMENYNYPLRLDYKRKTGVSTPNECAKMGRKDLDPALLKVADKMYMEDYKLLKQINQEYASHAHKAKL